MIFTEFDRGEQENTFEEDNQIIRDSLKAIGEKYHLTKVTDDEEAYLQKQLSQFAFFNQFEQVFIYGAAKIEEEPRNSYLIVTSLNHKIEPLTAIKGGESHNIAQFVFVGFKALSKDLGEFFIRPATTADKLTRFFAPAKAKIVHDKEFRKQYHIEVDSDQQVKEGLTQNFIDAIKPYDSLEIEVKGQNVLVRLPKGFSQEVSETIVNVLVQL